MVSSVSCPPLLAARHALRIRSLNQGLKLPAARRAALASWYQGAEPDGKFLKIYGIFETGATVILVPTKLAQDIHRIENDPTLTRAQKDALIKQAELGALQSFLMLAGSGLATAAANRKAAARSTAELEAQQKQMKLLELEGFGDYQSMADRGYFDSQGELTPKALAEVDAVEPGARARLLAESTPAPEPAAAPPPRVGKGPPAAPPSGREPPVRPLSHDASGPPRNVTPASPPRRARLNAELDLWLTEGPPQGRPTDQELAQAVTRIENGVGDRADYQTLLRAVTADAREVIRYEHAQGGNLSSQALKGNCGPGRDISAESLKAWTLLSKAKVTIRRYQASDLISKADHSFSIVEFPGNVRFIVDPTFGQFLEAGLYTGRGVNDYAVATPLRGDPAGLGLAHDLVGFGFVPLDADTAKLYVRGLGAEGAEIESAATKLWEGENALLLEVVQNGQVNKYGTAASLDEIDTWNLGRDEGSIISRLDKLVDDHTIPKDAKQALSDLMGDLISVRLSEQQSASYTKVTSTKGDPGSPPPAGSGPTPPSSTSTPGQLQRNITNYAEQGVPITPPAKAQIEHAETALKAGRPSLQDFQTIVQQASADSRTIAKLSKNNRALTYQCMKGTCGLGRDIAAASLASFAMESGIPVSLYRFDTVSAFGSEKGRHAFNVVIFRTEPPIAFIVDPTFVQFINPQGADPRQSWFSAQGLLEDPAGARVVHDLLRDGFIQLDEQTARLYTKGLLGSDYSGAMLEEKAAQLGKKLLSGEGALTEEVMGPQVGALPRGAHRGPMIHTTPELRARLDPQEIDLDTRGIGLDAVMKTHELVQDYQAAVRGDPQLEPIVNDLEKRLQKVLDNAQTPGSAPDVPPTPVTSPHPEPPASRTPSAVEPGRPTPQTEAHAPTQPQAKKPLIGATSGGPRAPRNLEALNPDERFRAAQQELQPLVDKINPGGGRQNCVPVTIAMDLSLAQGKAFTAPVTEEGFQQHTLEGYVGAAMSGTGARGLLHEMEQTGHGARAILLKWGRR